MLIHQKYLEDLIIITEEIYNAYIGVRQKLNEAKSGSSPLTKDQEDNLIVNDTDQKSEHQTIQCLEAFVICY